MRAGVRIGALLAALVLAGCSAPAQREAPPPSRETERTPETLPDAYKHPPK